MNKRWVRIALGALVLGTWGAVIQRAIRRPQADDAPAVQAALPAKAAPPSDAGEALPPLPRDPFLDNAVPGAEQRTQAPAATGNSARKAPSTPTAQKQWPDITYNGIVRPTGDASGGVAFLNVGGRSVMVGRGHDAEGVQVIDMTMDSVVVVWNTQRRTIHRR